MINVNEYFDGNVMSLSYETASGKATVGVMEQGTYEFGTGAPEIMTVVQGELLAKLPNESDFKSYLAGHSFSVPGNSKFEVKAVGQTSYLCQFL
jgi:purine/pyrimidine-nucleoside phosphorylase